MTPITGEVEDESREYMWLTPRTGWNRAGIDDTHKTAIAVRRVQIADVPIYLQN